jgi:putative transposase
MAMAQLAGRNSLRDIVENLSAQTHHIYHLGSAKLSRSKLSRINDGKPYALYEALFGKLLSRCQGVVPAHGFRYDHPLYFTPVVPLKRRELGFASLLSSAEEVASIESI